MGIKYQLFSMNAYIDGIIINDFVSDKEAISYAANYEATCYRINPDGTREMIYKPGDDDQNGEKPGRVGNYPKESNGATWNQ